MVLEIFAISFGLLYQIWLIVMFSAVTSLVAKYSLSTVLIRLIIIWSILAVGRVLMLVYSPSTELLFIPDPINTLLFVALGLVLFIGKFTMRRRITL